MDGVDRVVEGKDREQFGLNHERSGDLIAFAEEDAWFAYYFWEDDELAPEFARCIDIHRKYGYDPTELFVNPKISFPSLIAKLRSSWPRNGISYPYGSYSIGCGSCLRKSWG